MVTSSARAVLSAEVKVGLVIDRVDIVEVRVRVRAVISDLVRDSDHTH